MTDIDTLFFLFFICSIFAGFVLIGYACVFIYWLSSKVYVWFIDLRDSYRYDFTPDEHDPYRGKGDGDNPR